MSKAHQHQPDIPTKKQKETPPPNTSAIRSQMLDTNSMNYERERLKTFEHGWTNYSVDPHKLAKTGLYFIGREDIVRCQFCKKCIRHM